MTGHKQPISVLVVIHTAELDVLLLERAAHPGFWQSVTGSREDDEMPEATACREVIEETGIDPRVHRLSNWKIANTFSIFANWRQRYAPGVKENVEHVFGLLVTQRLAVTTAPDEHRDWLWLPWQEAAERCFSWSNRDAIRLLPQALRRL
jgi:dATP pyrophosphohydrolase